MAKANAQGTPNPDLEQLAAQMRQQHDLITKKLGGEDATQQVMAGFADRSNPANSWRKRSARWASG